MSGSPIYLYDGDHHARLAGAFAYGWPMQKEPVAGVQPIEYMLAMAGDGGRPAATPTAPLGRSAGPGRWTVPGRSRAIPLTVAEGGNALVPLATPLMTGGLSPRVLRELGPRFAAAGLLPTQAGGGGGHTDTDDPIVPGAVLGVPLVTGDVDMTAIGTCTEVIGDRVFAFGHPLNGDGTVALPFCGGQIQGVIASLNSSFKIGSCSAVRGTLTQDQSAGIAGRLGPGPATVPVTLRVRTADSSVEQTYRFAVVVHPKLTPVLVSAGLASALTGAKELPPHHTVDYDLTVEFDNGQTLHLADAAVDVAAGDLFAAVGGPLAGAADNPFASVMPKRITGTMTVTGEQRSAQILYASVPRSRYRPGEVVTAFVTYRPFRGDERTLPVAVPLPKDLVDGTYTLTIADAAKYLDDERSAEPFRFTAETIGQVFDVLRDETAVRHDAVYVRLMRQPDGVAIGRTAMAKLPGSRRQILAGSGRSDVTPFVSSARVVVPVGRAVTGSADFEVTVDRHADVPGR